MSDPIIVCQDVWHIYPGEVTALQGATLEIEQGEVLGVVGQNGSGKTTLVKHFNGLLKPSQGQVTINGLDSQKYQVHELARHAGYVFQTPNHHLFATKVRTELAFGPKNFGLSTAEIDERVVDAADFLDIHHLMEQHPYRLSFPLRKLVAMASIYAMGPSVFVLDEPTTGQDHRGANMVRRLVNRLRDQGKTVVIVSHDMALMAEVTDRLVALWSAEIIAVGKPAELFANTEVMTRTKLHPPQIFQFTQGWSAANGRTAHALTVPQAVDAFLAAQE
mgnify:CR=1 FL=1